MEPIYANVEMSKRPDDRRQTNQTDSTSSGRRCLVCVSVLLGLLSVLLLAGLAGLAIIYQRLVRHSWEVQTNLTDRLQASRHKLSVVSGEINSLRANLTEQSRELEKLRLRRHCPESWTKLNCSCYLLSTQSLSWEEARGFCIKNGADLVTIDNVDKQNYFSEKISGNTWIGLNDIVKENTWKWAMDNSTLNEKFWSPKQPDNGNQIPKYGEEDCVHLDMDTKKWNDLQCNSSMHFICEKLP